MITRSPIYNVARSLTSSQYEFIEREFGYSKTSFLDLPDETLVDIYYDLCDIEATALTRKGNLTSAITTTTLTVLRNTTRKTHTGTGIETLCKLRNAKSTGHTSSVPLPLIKD